MANSEDVLAREREERLTLIHMALGKVSVDFMRQSGDVVMPVEALLETASQLEELWAAEVRELRKQLQQSSGLQSGALRLKRLRDLRLQAIRDALSQNKGDNLVRREVEWLLDCDARELDGFYEVIPARCVGEVTDGK